MTTHSIKGHDAARHIQGGKQLGNGSDFVGFLGGLYLPERYAQLVGPGADQMDAFFSVRGAPLDGFPVYSYAVTRLHPLPEIPASPVEKTFLELGMVNTGQHPQDGVRAGDAVRQRKVVFQPSDVGYAEKGDVFNAFHTADHWR